MFHQKVGMEVGSRTCRHCASKTNSKIAYTESIAEESAEEGEPEGFVVITTTRLLKCPLCQQVTLEKIIESNEDPWEFGEAPIEILYPAEPYPPAKDMPAHIKVTYFEALAVFSSSPRSSAGLLRLAIQQLCIHLGKPGKELNKDIRAMVKEGLPSWVQQALDSVRVIGNDAVHPGSNDFNDDNELVRTLFGLVNAIVEAMITRPREIKEIYEKLPQNKRDAIERQDNERRDNAASENN